MNDNSNGSVETKPRNLGRAYLIQELGRHGFSRRRAKRILNLLLDEIKWALALNEPVEFPFGWLQREKKISRHWELLHDEPMKPYGEPMKLYTVEHYTDKEGIALLGGLENMERPDRCWSFFASKSETPPYRKPHRPWGRPPAFNRKQVGRILAMAGGPPPEGRKRWTVKLIAEEAAKRKLAPKVSWETMRSMLREKGWKPSPASSGRISR
jgi:hypothetical protein